MNHSGESAGQIEFRIEITNTASTSLTIIASDHIEFGMRIIELNICGPRENFEPASLPFWQKWRIKNLFAIRRNFRFASIGKEPIDSKITRSCKKRTESLPMRQLQFFSESSRRCFSQLNQ